MPPKVPKCLVKISLCPCKKKKSSKDLTASTRDSFQLSFHHFEQMAVVHYPEEVDARTLLNSFASFIFLKTTTTKHQFREKNATVIRSMPFPNKDHKLVKSLLLHSWPSPFSHFCPMSLVPATQITNGVS